MPPRRNGKHWEQLLQKTDLEFLLSGKKGDRPVEARLVDFVWRSRQSLGRGLAIFHRSRFNAAPPAAFPAKSAAATLSILFLSLLHYQGEGGLFWHIWVLPLKNWNSWMFFFAAPVPGGGSQPQLLSHLQQAVHDRRAVDGTHEVCPQGPQCLRGARWVLQPLHSTSTLLLMSHPNRGFLAPK